MQDEAVFSILSKCFAPVERAEWDTISKPAQWADFLNGARRALQDEKTFGCQTSAVERLGRKCPLQEDVYKRQEKLRARNHRLRETEVGSSHCAFGRDELFALPP